MVNILTYLTLRSHHSATLPKTIMETLTFTPSQSHSLTFPVGCPVWYFPNRDTDENGGYCIVQGTVEQVSMDLRQLGKLYHRVVGANGKVIGDGFILESDLSYAFQCPVVVTLESGEKLEGVVLQAKIVGDSMVYTVMHGVSGGFTSYKEGIGAEKVRYNIQSVIDNERKSEVEEKVAVVERDQVDNDPEENANDEPPVAEVTCGSVRSMESGNDKTKSAPGSVSQSVASVTEKKSVQSSSIEQGQVLEGATRGYNNLEPSPETNRNNDAERSPKLEHQYLRADSMEKVPAKKAKLSLEDEKYPSFDITLPLWLQKDKESRDKLYAHLYGPSHHPHYKRMREEINCNMYVYNHESSEEPMTIRISHLVRERHLKDFHLALKMIQEILLDFQLPNHPKIRHDGSAGRLLYEIGNSCRGGHKPVNSTSNALTGQINPLSFKGKTCCLSLVELPSDGKRVHGKFLEKDWFYSSIRKGGCSMKLCGDEFGFPVRYGKPYVLIVGNSSGIKNVDRAVEMVKKQIEKHRANCTCT